MVTEVSVNSGLDSPTTAELPISVGTAAHFSLHHLASGQACVSVVSSTGLQCNRFQAQEAPEVCYLPVLRRPKLSWHPP